MTRTYYVKITERIEEDELRGLISRVSETRRVEVLKKRRMEDRIQGIVSEFLEVNMVNHLLTYQFSLIFHIVKI